MSSPHARTLLERHLTRPISLALSRVENSVRELNDLLRMPAALDQFPGRIIPFSFQRWYGPIALTTARRYDDGANNGFEKLATVASPSTFIVPRQKGNIRTNRRGVFRWESAAINSYISWTWSSNQSMGGGAQQAFTPVGDIFDQVIGSNGGAMLMNNNRFVDTDLPSTAEDVPNASFELGLYDKKRNRYLHDGTRLPTALFSGQAFINRLMAEPMPIGDNTEIEPQLYVDEVRVRNVMNTDTIFNAVQFRLYVSLTLLGSIEQD